MLRFGLTGVATLRSALRAHQNLILENLALRHQLELLTRGDRQARFRPVDRLLWVGLRRCWADWRDALVLVQPATVIRWHREGFRRYWRRRSQRQPGRPRLAARVSTLIRQMARANPLWGAPRIHGELLMLGSRRLRTFGLAVSTTRAPDSDRHAYGASTSPRRLAIGPRIGTL